MKNVNAGLTIATGKLALKMMTLVAMMSVAGLVHAQRSGSIFESQPSTPSQSSGGISNEGLNLLLDQVRQLQMEVQQLRARSDEQGHNLRILQRESLDRYTNTDNRLSILETGQPAGLGLPGSSTSDANTNANNGNFGSNGINAANEPFSPATSQAGSGQQDPFYSRPTESLPGAVNPGNNAAANINNTTISGVSARPGLQPAVLSEQQMYQMAYDSVINSDFDRSVAEFDQYLASYPDGRFVANAYYWKGQAYLYLSRFSEARDAYQTILNQYPQSTKLPDAMYGLGQAYEGLGDIPQARTLLTDIIRRYPNTGVANLADTRLMSLD